MAASRTGAGGYCHALTFNVSVFFIFCLGQGVTRVGLLVFVLSRVFVCLGFCRSRYLYVYGGLICFPIRGSRLSLSRIGDYI